MQKFLLVLSSCCLIACGGGGGSSTTSSNATTPVTPPTTAPTSALKDNTVASNASFTQFESFLTQLPNKTAQFKGKSIYIKLYTSDGQTLYLGQYLPDIRLNLHLPNHVKTLRVDIFSTEPTDPQFTEEIVL